MYFEIEDYKPDITPVGSVISWREGVLLSVIVHLAAVIFLLMAPKLFPVDEKALRARQLARLQPRERQDSERFVFVQPRADLSALKPPARAESSDLNRERRSPQSVPQPNALPFSRGNTRERVEESQPDLARGPGPMPEPAEGQTVEPQPDTSAAQDQTRFPESQSTLQFPTNRPNSATSPGQRPLAGGQLGDALRNLQRYVQRDQFENTQGGGAFGPAIQFDTKGVEFGPWIRRFVAQVKRNWEPLIPLAAMTMKGRVVVTFNVHKDGTITDLSVVAPCPIDSFNTAAYGALASSNPTAALPPEYPADKAFFTVTFFYNEDPS
jgi:TonB family protein